MKCRSLGPTPPLTPSYNHPFSASCPSPALRRLACSPPYSQHHDALPTTDCESTEQAMGGLKPLTLRSVVKTPSLDLKLSWVLGHNSEKLIHMSTD